VRPSKGRKRANKGKRKRTSSPGEPVDVDPEAAAVQPPMPSIAGHILVGLNSVTRYLSALAAHDNTHREASAEEAAARATASRPLSVVILPHPMPSSSLPHAHLPALVCLSSAKADPQTRLVALSTATESRLAAILELPRASAIGILEGAPGADAFVEYVRNHVEPVRCDWIEQGLKAEWRGLQTTQGP
jgi:ribonuclease P/MRP protein subunit POP3